MQPWFWHEILNLGILASGCEGSSCPWGVILSPLAILTQGQKVALPFSRLLGQWAQQNGDPIPLVWGAGVDISQRGRLWASRPRKSWLRRCLLRETNRSLNPSLLNFYIFYVLSPWFINFRLWSKLLNLSECQVCNLLKLKTLFSLRVFVTIHEVRCWVQVVIDRCHLPS